MSAKLLVMIAGCALVSWLGYLAYLAGHRQTNYLSRPQFLVANFCVIAELASEDGHPKAEIKIIKVRWASSEAEGQKLVGKTIAVKDLEKCQHSNGWQGPGTYIITMTKLEHDADFSLAQIPPSPGFRRNEETHNYLRIYPADSDGIEQLEALIIEFRSEH
jgi:hypothetical protein